MQFKPYPEYKDSGVEWLGEIGASFNLKRLKHLSASRLSYGANEAADEAISDHPRFIRITDIADDGRLKSDTFRSLPPEKAGPYMLADGDILLARSGATVGKSFKYLKEWGLSCYAGYLIKFSTDYRNNNSSFIYYYLNSIFYWNYIRSSEIQSTIQNVSAEKYSDLIVTLPSADEQSKIVSFLDGETTKIDNLIAKQEKLIELLEEQRKSVITHAVTKGLDPDAPMKDSGVEWLGEVPAHWDTSSLKYLCNINTGNNDTVDSVENGIYPFFVRSQLIERINEYSFDCEAILTAGDGAGVGKIYHHYKGRFSCHQRVYALTDFKRISPDLFFYFFSNLFEKVALDGGAKSTVDSLRKAHFDNFIMVVPPDTEQFQIVEFLNREVVKIDKSISKQKDLIEKLKEYRSSVISHAVTGKIDVRDMAA
ncbi:restriction endonuclease subunit S [Brucella anthropi]|uniref:Restriction endonuclease subunit S n=1 Tax=Brucella anthropi TaxID=529 RepID=A0A6L3ZBC4_BRUAN|nr:restriction endonuclease subunit S [Brucella anthropi]KAB2773593.1 restriction endonuclease subunit S [Brucella anthropi]